MHEAVAIGERQRAVVERTVVSGADQVADLVGKRVHGGGALVMDRGEGVGRLGGNADR